MSAQVYEYRHSVEDAVPFVAGDRVWVRLSDGDVVRNNDGDHALRPDLTYLAGRVGDVHYAPGPGSAGWCRTLEMRIPGYGRVFIRHPLAGEPRRTPARSLGPAASFEGGLENVLGEFCVAGCRQPRLNSCFLCRSHRDETRSSVPDLDHGADVERAGLNLRVRSLRARILSQEQRLQDLTDADRFFSDDGLLDNLRNELAFAEHRCQVLDGRLYSAQEELARRAQHRAEEQAARQARQEEKEKAELARLLAKFGKKAVSTDVPGLPARPRVIDLGEDHEQRSAQ